MTEQEVKEQKESWRRKRNFGSILALSGVAASLFGAGMIVPALMYPGVLINGYYMAKEENKHIESWKSRWKKMIPIFNAKSHGHDDHGGHGDSHAGSHGGGHH